MILLYERPGHTGSFVCRRTINGLHAVVTGPQLGCDAQCNAIFLQSAADVNFNREYESRREAR